MNENMIRMIASEMIWLHAPETIREMSLPAFVKDVQRMADALQITMSDNDRRMVIEMTLSKIQ